MSLTALLGTSVGITCSAWLGHRLWQVHHRRAVRRLAAAADLHFSADDRFCLAARVAQNFPVCGVADLQVVNLIYGLDNDRYRYIFTAEYTQGVVRTKRRLRRVVACCEPRDRTAPDLPLTPILAPADLSILAQYQHLITPTRSAVCAS